MPRKKEHLSIRCNRCERRTDQLILASYIDTVVYEDEETEYEFTQDYPLRLTKCSSCNAVNYTVQFDDGDIRVLYPPAPKALEGLPREVARAYKAARTVRHVDPNAFAVLLGRVLDLVCMDRGASGSTLHDQLDDLASRGEIPSRLADMAHQLRILRNIGAHANLGRLTASEVPILDDLCEAVLDYLYTAPHRITRVGERIKRLKRLKR